jgi:hypothetical protein
MAGRFHKEISAIDVAPARDTISLLAFAAPRSAVAVKYGNAWYRDLFGLLSILTPASATVSV